MNERCLQIANASAVAFAPSLLVESEWRRSLFSCHAVYGMARKYPIAALPLKERHRDSIHPLQPSRPFFQMIVDTFLNLCYDRYRSRCAPVAQLDRVFGYEPKGRGFESLPAYQNKPVPSVQVYFLPFKKRGGGYGNSRTVKEWDAYSRYYLKY